MTAAEELRKLSSLFFADEPNTLTRAADQLEALEQQGAGQPQHLPASAAHGADIRAQAAKMRSSLWAIAKTLDDNELRDYALQAYESAALPSAAPILEREAFEGEMKILWDLDPEDFELAFRRNKHEPEKYRDYEMQKAWTIWKAARAALSAPAIPTWISVEERLPEDETPVLILRRGEVDLGELVWERPGFEDTYTAFRFWDRPNDDGQGWEWDEITHWMPLPAAPIPPPQAGRIDDETN